MALMREKIKNLFGFVGRAWSGGIFWGEVNVQKFIMNIWRLSAEQEQLAHEQKKLDSLARHITLIQDYSPDYVQELGLKYLNVGDPNFKILKL